jgi:geranylgeranylglycerol-phosphate geranylgeranyltransferase
MSANREGARGALKRRGRQAWAALRLLRPVNALLLVVGVGVGGLLAGGSEVLQGDGGRRLLLAAASAALVGGAANSLNDVFDLPIDRLNRPGRPLPMGLVTPGAARLLWGLGSLGGLLLAVRLSAAHVVMAAGAVLLLVCYNALLKRLPLVGNVAVALLLGLALLYGGWAVGAPAASLVGAAFAFLTTLAREVVKDLEDAPGDALLGARTLPVRYGPEAAVGVVLLTLALTVAATPLPFALLDYSGLYLLLVLLADAFLLRTGWILLKPGAGRGAGDASHTLKVAMAAGLSALALAR